MVQRHSVHGLTTAAGIWVSAGIGMSVAAGLYAIAAAATALSLVGLEALGWAFRGRHGVGEEADGRPSDCGSCRPGRISREERPGPLP